MEVNPGVYPPERRQEIVRRTRGQGRTEVGALARALSVTPETIRRDLTALEDRHLLRRVHGGAVAVTGSGPEPGAPEQEHDPARAAREQRIAEAALRALPDSGSILLDACGAATRLAELLPADRELTVVTPSLVVASRLARRPGLCLHLLGGQVRERTLATAGRWAARAIGDMFVDVAFMTVQGITPDHGLTVRDPAAADIKRALIGAARRTVVLADHNGFGRVEPAHVADLGAVDLVIGDAGLDSRSAAQITASGPRIELA